MGKDSFDDLTKEELISIIWKIDDITIYGKDDCERCQRCQSILDDFFDKKQVFRDAMNAQSEEV